MGEDEVPQACYDAGARATLAVLRIWVEKHRDRPPLFAFPPKDIGLIGSLADIGYRLARNESARQLVGVLIDMRAELGLHDYPTAMMLRAALAEVGVETEIVGLAELGLTPIGGGGGVN
jgi:hypothetical protein